MSEINEEFRVEDEAQMAAQLWGEAPSGEDADEQAEMANAIVAVRN